MTATGSPSPDIRGVEARPPSGTPLPQVVADRARSRPLAAYLQEVNGRELTYAAAHEEALAWAATLQDEGVAPADTVAVVLPTSATAVTVSA